MLRILIVLLAITLLLYTAACAALYHFQRSMIYLPPQGESRDGDPTVQLQVPGATLLVSVRQPAGQRAVIYFGGNAEDVSQSAPDLSAAFPDQALYLMHYRGYSGSGGTPSEEALHADALALFDTVARTHAQVTVIGRSLGSCIAARLASERPVDRLVLVTPYDSVQSLAAAQFPYFPVRWLLKDKYETWRYAPRVTAPTRLIEAERDEIVPRASTRTLLTRFAPGVAELKVVAGAGHNDISASPAYLALLNSPR